MKKRLTAALLTGVMAAMSLTGCAKETSTPATETGEEQVVIKTSGWDISSTVGIQSHEALIAAFEETHPNIKVELTDIPSADYTKKLSIMLNGGDDLDVVWPKDGDTLPALAAKGHIEDLTPYIERDKIDMSQYNGVDSMNFDGKQYGMPFQTSYYVLFYNKDIFDAAGVPYPSNDMTWKEFEELAAKLTSGEGVDKTYGAFLHSWNGCVFNWALQDGEHTILGPDYEFMKPAYEMALRMQEAGTIMDYSTIKTGNIHYSGPFSQGKVAMLPMGNYFCNTMIDKVKSGESTVNWGIATIPHPEGVEAGYTIGGVSPIAINAKSKHKEEAWEFVKFICGEEGAKVSAEIGQFPALKGEKALEAIATREGMPEGALEALQTKNMVLDRPLDVNSAAVNQMLEEEHSLIMVGEGELDEVLKEMGERSREIQGIK